MIRLTKSQVIGMHHALIERYGGIHVTIQTDKYDEELEFYEKTAGLQVIRDMRSMGRKMVFLADADGDMEIEIIGNPNAVSAGNQHLSIGFQAENLQALYDALTAAGMDVSPMVEPAPHVRFFFVKDPAGVSVQFM